MEDTVRLKEETEEEGSHVFSLYPLKPSSEQDMSSSAGARMLLALLLLLSQSLRLLLLLFLSTIINLAHHPW